MSHCNRRRRGTARRPVRHLPGEPVPAVRGLGGGPAARAGRLPRRGAGRTGLLRPAGAEQRRLRGHARDRAPRDRSVRGLRLCRRAVRAPCIGTIKADYPELLAADEIWRPKAEALAARAFELTSFLVDVLGVQGVDARLDATVTYHDSCSGLRELGVREQPRKLLASVDGLTLVESRESEVCCGFGGTFCVKYPEISGKMVTDKVANIEASGAEVLLGGDLGCLLNIAGRLHRLGKPQRVFHVAEVLAGIGGQRSDRHHGHVMHAAAGTFKQRASIALKDVTLQASLGKLTREGLVVRRAKAIAEFPEFQALREEGRRIKDHVLAHLDFYLERYEAEVTKAGGKVHWARDAEEARTIVRRAVSGGQCEDGGARQVDGRRRNRRRRCARGRRPSCRRDRPRRIHHPARARAAQPHHRAGRAQDEGAGRPALRGRAPRAGHRRRTRAPSPRWWTRRGEALRQALHSGADMGISGVNFMAWPTAARWCW